MEGADVDATRSQEHRLRRVIVSFVEVHQFAMGELDDLERVAAGIECVRRSFEEVFEDAAMKNAHRVSERALHLVEHHALVGELVAFTRVSPSFLPEAQVVEFREERGVQVDVEQILEVGLVGGCERIERPVRIGHRVHEQRCRPAEHRKERIGNGEAFRAAQGEVFEDVGPPIAGKREGRERDDECEFILVVRQMDMAGAVRVSVLLEGRLQGGQPGFGLFDE